MSNRGERHQAEGAIPPLPFVWRIGTAARIASWAIVAVCSLTVVALAVWVAFWPSPDLLAAILVSVLCLFLGVMFWRIGIHPSIRVAEEGLIVRNPLGTISIQWSDVADAFVDPDGIVITQRGAPPIVVSAVKKSDWSSWRGTQTRADALVAMIPILALEYGNDVVPRTSTQRDVFLGSSEPLDAVERPLKFPWRMSFIEGITIDFLRNSSSWVVSAITALVFASLGSGALWGTISEMWDERVLQNRGIVVEATVLEVPGALRVTWPGIAPESKFVDGGDDAPEVYSPGDLVDVISDPHRPTRAHLVGYKVGTGEKVGSIAVGLGGLFLGSGYAKWSRWLLAESRGTLPPPRQRRRWGTPR